MLAVNAVFAPAADTHLGLTHTPLGLTPHRFQGSVERCSTTAYKGIDIPVASTEFRAESLEACIAFCLNNVLHHNNEAASDAMRGCSHLHFDNEAASDAMNCYLYQASSPKFMVEVKDSADIQTQVWFTPENWNYWSSLPAACPDPTVDTQDSMESWVPTNCYSYPGSWGQSSATLTLTPLYFMTGCSRTTSSGTATGMHTPNVTMCKATCGVQRLSSDIRAFSWEADGECSCLLSGAQRCTGMFMAYEGAVKNMEAGTDLSEATKDNINLALHYEKCVTRAPTSAWPPSPPPADHHLPSTPPSPSPTGGSGDPHLHFARGGRADFRGSDGAHIQPHPLSAPRKRQSCSPPLVPLT